MHGDKIKIRDREEAFLVYATQNLVALAKQAKMRNLMFLAYLIEIAAHEAMVDNTIIANE